MNIVAVTSCISGVAHTYMAAELLEKYGQKSRINIQVETQGALGVENELSKETITEADIVIIIADISIEGADRFENKRTITTRISTFLRQPELVFDSLERAYNSPPNTRIEV